MQGQPVKNWREYTGEDRVISAQEMLLKFKETPESVLRVKTDIPSLDAAIDGVRDGELIAVSGPTKMGKTLPSEKRLRFLNRITKTPVAGGHPR